MHYSIQESSHLSLTLKDVWLSVSCISSLLICLYIVYILKELGKKEYAQVECSGIIHRLTMT